MIDPSAKGGIKPTTPRGAHSRPEALEKEESAKGQSRIESDTAFLPQNQQIAESEAWLSPEEATNRMNATLQKMIKTPPMPHKKSGRTSLPLPVREKDQAKL